MSKDRERDMPKVGGRRETKVTPGPKPKNKECHVVDKDGNVNWDATQKDFPIDRRG